MNDNNQHQQSAINTYRQHVAARQLYIDKCEVVRNELDNMDQQAIESIVSAYLGEHSHSIPYYHMLMIGLSLSQFVKTDKAGNTPTHIDGSDSDSSNRDNDSYGDIVQPSLSPAT